MSAVDETWIARDYRAEIGVGAVVIEGGDVTQTIVYMGIERATLAAAAPDLARVLLAVEWGGSTSQRDGGDDCCPECVETRVQGHADDCALDAALRKAGLR